MIKIGMMIGERYEILEKIGTGGMSDVYKAKCHKLNRFVAVKVLKQEFSENANFVSKFRIEAQAAAGLMHPNIVNVYDVGEENGIYYIVMELVEGITLKKYIEKKARLSYKEAVSIAIQVSMGIEAAHRNKIIHRDIKPQNIIISKEGKVKVTDFGIAKAATSNTITSNVMGSVHYTSPEQARGGYSDEKSDVYSLGITMYEMLTGRVPFNGETTVAIAIKHIQEELPTPREYVPEIPLSVEEIVLKCCQKSPDRRYQSMSQLIEDLKQSLINPDRTFVAFHDQTDETSTRHISDAEISQIKKHTGGLRLRSEVERQESYQDDEEIYQEDEEEEDFRMEKITAILAIVAGIIICCVIIVLVGKITGLFRFGDSGNKVIDGQQSQTQSVMPSSSEVPESETPSQSEQEPVAMIPVRGKTVREAVDALRELDLEPEIEYEESDEYETDIVIRASASQGTLLQPGSIVTLTVSSGTSAIAIPTVAGHTYEAAFNALSAKGFVVEKTESYSPTVAKGYVIYQSPGGGEKAPEGSTVVLNVSLGEAKVTMPNLIGRTEDEAVALLIEAGLSVGNVSEMNSDQIEEGLVCYQSYSYGVEVEKGTAVDLKLSMGPSLVTYKLNASIAAPTMAEAPDYVAGTPVKVAITTSAGKLVLETITSSFPLSANATGIPSSGGTILFTYEVTPEPEIQVDPETGEQVTIPGDPVEKSFERTIEFMKE